MHYTLAQAEATFVLTSASAGTQEAKAISAAARIATEVGNALIATADEAAAATAAAKSVAGAQALAAGASVLAGQVLTIAAAGAGKVFADANIAASLTASNDAADAVHTYVVASIGVNLIASTAATGFALLRENAAITAMTTAQKSAINATHTATLANLADDLIGRNASEALDDPIAIAAAGNAAAAANKAAWETVRNLQARAAITFAGTGPGAGGFSMGFAGFTGWVGDQFDVVWAGGVGLTHGLAIVGNSLTAGYFGSLDSYVDGLIEENGGMYGASEKFANLGTFALLLAGGYAAAGAASTVSATYNIPMGFAFFSEGGALAIGATGSIPITITGTHVLQAAAGGLWMFMSGPGFEKSPGGNNVSENQKVRYICHKLGIRDQKRIQEIHRNISKQGYSLEEIEHLVTQIAEEMGLL